jgi:hypothetical protein
MEGALAFLKKRHVKNTNYNLLASQSRQRLLEKIFVFLIASTTESFTMEDIPVAS